jgi:hypothetical protein
MGRDMRCCCEVVSGSWTRRILAQKMPYQVS